MHEIKPHPGITYYVRELNGTLTYTFKLGDKPTRTFELDGADFEASTSEPADDVDFNMAGTAVSAVGLDIKLVKNDGIIEMQYQGEGGNTAEWAFDGLQETSRQSGMYASATTQTCLTILDLKPTPKNMNSLIDAESVTVLRQKDIQIKSVIGKDKDGTLWKISCGGAAERIPDQDMAVTQLTAVEAPTVARRVSNRKRAEISVPHPTPESLPYYIYLPGQIKIEKGHLVDGILMLDQATSSITFETKGELIQPEMVPDVSNEVLWKPYQGMHRLQVFFEGDPEFTSYHNSEQADQIVGRNKDYNEYTHRIHLEDFLSELKSCLISEDMVNKKKKRKIILKRRRIVSGSEEE
ncbi:hypothetical protein HBH56_009440 [Parastagonospora nodorum]|nr:hypothetical protein HBH56_009440 [Parastagonospora nodorum]KAH3935092.1 hypothetical protein HBH54_042730 [Parastagonospora nodorum]KAH4060429.1 hypothetical protein HBH49_001920 [Parastagonospora nodorum]KAH4073080.1 hypothetical protein HBH50_049300 [Parastagonospora nodorum]KAH4108795.1 hypothetical protein HBH46_034740 [Parastagonospora nodorum]